MTLYGPIAWMRTMLCRCVECLRSTHGRGADWVDAGIDAPSDPLVDAIAAQLAWWLPSSPTYAKPGNAPRLPEDLQLCLIANDAEHELAGDVDADAIRAQIEPDLRWHACSRRPLNLAGQATAIRTLDRRHGDSRERAWGLDFQRRIEAREWDEGYRMRRFGDESGVIGFQHVDGRREYSAGAIGADVLTAEQLAAGAIGAGLCTVITLSNPDEEVTMKP